MLALIGGSGFTGNDVIEDCEEIEITTPWGLRAHRLSSDASAEGRSSSCVVTA